MIGLPRGVTVYAFDEPCDMRKSFDTLTALVSSKKPCREAPSARPSRTRAISGRGCFASSTTRAWRSTTARRSARCAVSSWVAKITTTLVFAVAFVSTFWTTSFGRSSFVLDSSPREPTSLTPAYALATILVLRTLQAGSVADGARRGMSPSLAAVVAIVYAAVAVLPASCFGSGTNAG